MKRKVVIIGHGYTSRLGLIRSLAELDCEITVVAMVFNGRFGRLVRGEGWKPIDGYSKYVHRVLYCPVTDEEGLIRLLLRKCADPAGKVVLIPDSDFSAAVVDRNRTRLQDAFLFPTVEGGTGLVEHWMDKISQKTLAREVGMHVAEGYVVTVQGGHYVLPMEIPYPCFTKALATISGGKQFLKRCNDERELRRVLDKVARRYETNVLIEEFKQIDKEYAVVGLADGEDVIIPAVIEFVENTQSHFGIACKGRILPVDGFEEMIASFRTFVEKMGFRGLFDIDFYESAGVLYFSEMNLRFGGSGYAVTRAGVNLPAMFVLRMYGEDCSGMNRSVIQPLTYVNERMALDDFVGGYLDKKGYEDVVGSADIRFVYDASDPGPQRQYRRYVFFQSIRRRIKKTRKKFRNN